MNSMTFDDLTKGVNIFEGAKKKAAVAPTAAAEKPKETVGGGFSSLTDSILQSSENIEINASKIEHNLGGAAIDENNDEPTAGADKPEKEITGKKRPQFLNGKSAKMYVVTYDILTSRIAAAFAGEPEYRKYKLDAQDKKEFEKICEEYFESVDIEISPTTMFVVLNLMFFGGTMWKAWTAKNEKKKSTAARAAVKAKFEDKNGNLAIVKDFTENNTDSQAGGDINQEEKREEVIDNFNRAAQEIKRTRFEIDKQGYYKRDENGEYLKTAERIEKPTQDILELLKEGKKNKEIKKYLNLLVAEQLKK